MFCVIMRTLVVVVLFGCFMVGATARPSRLDEGNESEGEEVEYNNAEDNNNVDESVREEAAIPNDNAQSASDQEELEEYQNDAAQNDEVQDLGPNADLRHEAIDNRAMDKPQTDNIPEYKTCKSDSRYGAQSVDEYQPLMTNRQSRYYEHSDTQPAETIRKSQHSIDHDFTNSKLDPSENSETDNKLVGSRAALNEESDFLSSSLSKHGKDNKAAIREYDNGPGESSEQAQYLKHYYNTMQANRNAKIYGNVHNSINRDRRETQEADHKDMLSTPKESEGLDSNAEEEEAAIKRHIKKLSPDELEELMSSLSQDKRDLLKKIMDSDVENNSDTINKREITKKAGAAENSLESLSDSSKLQGSSSDDSNTGTPLNTGSTVSSKQTDTPSDPSDLPASKINDITSVSPSDNPLDLSNSGDILSSLEKLDGSASTSVPALDLKNQVSVDSNSQVTSKTEIKREANLNDMVDLDLTAEDQTQDQELIGSQDDNAYFCSQDDDLSQLADEDFNLNNDENISKREANAKNYEDLSQSIKSLEESFPNPSYDESNPYSGSDMAPHIRVKRKNDELVVKKRAAALLPDAKVAYVPYRAENEDEDSDEGNEFDDDGFYDRTSSLTKNRVNEKSLDEEPNNGLRSAPKSKTRLTQENPNSNKLTNEGNLETEVSNLGSDTDSVLSGGEGVDENLMFSSGCRNRRMDEEADAESDVNEVEEINPAKSTPLRDDEGKSPGNAYIGAPKYEESDAFGPLPRSYEGELGRYKRIRRVKQPPASRENSNK